MNPVFFYIGNRPIYWYGVMTAAAFIACIIHWNILGKRQNQQSISASNLAILLILSGIIGARIGYVLANFSDFVLRPLDIFRVDKGGLIFLGGLIAASAAVIIFARYKHEKLWPLADFIITAIPLGHGIGRIGCFLNGCCYGTYTNSPFAVEMHGMHRHPTQIYSAMWNFTIYFALLLAYTRKLRSGRVLALYMMLYPAGRFMIEFFRGDERIRLLEFTITQYICFILLSAGIALWFLVPAQIDTNEQNTRSDS